MWGNFITDLAYQTNYWFSFPTSNSDVLLNLGSWQYWWWFWFTFYICLYYTLFARLIRHRTLKFSPRITTSQKAHGKWGDFIICFVPIAWCVNILSNSNFILRMLEWQTESNSFMVRIRGRQWYWVYKIELQDLLRLENLTRNIGHDNWDRSFETTAKWKQIELNSFVLRVYERDVLNNTLQVTKENRNKFQSYNSMLFSNKNNSLTDINTINANNLMFAEEINNIKIKTINDDFKSKELRARILNESINSYELFFKQKLTTMNLQNNSNINITHTTSNFNNRSRRLGSFKNISALNLIANNDQNKFIWVNNNSTVKEKPITDNLYFVLKQKRYTPQIRKVNTIQVTTSLKQLKLISTSTLELINEHHQTDRFLTKRMPVHSPIANLISNRRLLRTRRTLVLPANTNITLLTNSFDVVHSWYVPGLGLKVDCIPGRSTHHTLFIDNAGSYYGQCAEICGRYHHHMPIRVCALPFDQFIIWWYHFGLPYFNATRLSRTQSIKTGLMQYVW